MKRAAGQEGAELVGDETETHESYWPFDVGSFVETSLILVQNRRAYLVDCLLEDRSTDWDCKYYITSMAKERKALWHLMALAELGTGY